MPQSGLSIDISCMSLALNLVDAYSKLVLPHCGVDHSNVEVDLRGIRICGKNLKGFLEVLIVIIIEGFHPRFDFLLRRCLANCQLDTKEITHLF